MFRVLYVDDDRDLRDLAELSLSADPDIETLAAADGRTALQVVRDRPIDLVIADLRMPDMDGLTLLQRLRAEPDAARRPCVLVTTAGPTAADRDRILAAGAAGLLKKPFDPLDLPRIVRHVLDGAQTPGAVTASRDAAFGLLR